MILAVITGGFMSSPLLFIKGLSVPIRSLCFAITFTVLLLLFWLAGHNMMHLAPGEGGLSIL